VDPHQARRCPAVGAFGVGAYDADVSDDFWFTETGFTTPTTLSLGTVGKPGRTKLKSSPAFFDAKGVVDHPALRDVGRRHQGAVLPDRQGWPAARRLDPDRARGLRRLRGVDDPGLRRRRRRGWLERGGALAVANIRGGGEYGPAGTRPRSSTTASAPTTTSSRSPRI
jgi:prolyl oligopeptidase